MKSSEEWNRQPKVDEAADAIVIVRGCKVTQVTVTEVALALGAHPNTSIYAKVRDWRRRRLAGQAGSAVDLPSAAETSFQDVIDRHRSDLLREFSMSVRAAVSEHDRRTAPVIAAANADRDQAIADTAELVAGWEQAEQQVEQLKATVAELREQVVDEQRHVQRLLGRLEEREAIIKGSARAEPGDGRGAGRLDSSAGDLPEAGAGEAATRFDGEQPASAQQEQQPGLPLAGDEAADQNGSET